MPTRTEKETTSTPFPNPNPPSSPLPKNTVIHGDTLLLLPQLPASSINAIITDPPYNSGGQSAGDRSKRPSEKYVQTGQATHWEDFDSDTMDGEAFRDWCYRWLVECYRVAADGAPILIFTDWRQLGVTANVLQQAGFIRRGCVVWDKGGGCRPQKGRFSHQAEYIVWGSKGKMPLSRKVGTLPGVFRHGVERPGEKLHMTGKPVPLMEDLLQIVEPGGTVLDPFAGSGSTLVAALKKGLGYIGIEKTEHYHKVATNRLAKASELALAALVSS